MLQSRYSNAIDQIRQRLAGAAGLTGGDTTRAADVARLAEQLPVYTGLVDKALNATKSVGPALLGSAYLREASSYLRTVLLPAADRLWHDEISRLSSARSTAFWTAGTQLLLLLAGLAILGLVQWSLAVRTHRVFNRGLLGTTALVLVILGATGWSLRAWLTTEQRLGAVERLLADQRQLVGEERSALAAEADTYVRLDGTSTLSSEEFRKSFRDNAQCDADHGNASVAAWCGAYDQWIDAALKAGDNDDAVTAALPNGKVEVVSTAVTSSDADAINRGAKEILDQAHRVPPAPSQLAPLIIALCVGAAISGGLGFRARTKDYFL